VSRAAHPQCRGGGVDRVGVGLRQSAAGPASAVIARFVEGGEVCGDEKKSFYVSEMFLLQNQGGVQENLPR
jgi:hypothetical protein